MPLGHHLAAAGDGFGNPVEPVLEDLVGQRIAGHERGGVPAGGEQRVALTQRVRRLPGEAGISERPADPPGRGEHLEEQLAREGRPAVAARPFGSEVGHELGERFGVGAQVRGDFAQGERLGGGRFVSGLRLGRGSFERLGARTQPADRRGVRNRAGAGEWGVFLLRFI